MISNGLVDFKLIIILTVISDEMCMKKIIFRLSLFDCCFSDKPLTRCCNCCDAFGNSDTESNDSSALFGRVGCGNGRVGSRHGISSAESPSTLSTTDFGRSFRP